MYDEAGMADKKSKDAPIDREIDKKICDLYKETLDEDVPDRFAELLERLRKKEQGE